MQFNQEASQFGYFPLIPLTLNPSPLVGEGFRVRGKVVSRGGELGESVFTIVKKTQLSCDIGLIHDVSHLVRQ